MYACMSVLVSLSSREISTALNFNPMKTKGVLVLKLGATKSDSARCCFLVAIAASLVGRPKKKVNARI